MKKSEGNLPAQKSDANYIDKIVKENCKNLAVFVLRRIFGVEFSKIENLPEIKQQVTIEKEPDFLRKLYNKEFPDGAILHLEFETSDSTVMDARMLFYMALLFRNLRKPVLQYVLYLGVGKAKMNTQLQFVGLDYRFEVISMEDFSYKEFIDSDVPEEVIMSLLADRENLTYEEILELILLRIVQINDDSYAIRKFSNQLIMLSRLRNLQILTKEKVKNMGVEFNILEDPFYVEGIEKGIEKGKRKNQIKGILDMIIDGVQLEKIVNYSNAEPWFVKTIKKQSAFDKQIVIALKKGEALDTIAIRLNVEPLLVEVISDRENEKK